MGIDRSNISYRTILFFFALFVTPSAASPATIEGSARELARKVAAALPASDRVSIEVRNISSLTPDEVSVVEKSLKDELQNQAGRPSAVGTDVVHVQVTISESIKSFLWAAEINRPDAAQVLFLEVPRPSEDRIVPSAMPTALRSEKFWEGSQRILDAATLNESNGEPLLLLLTEDKLLIRKIGSDMVSAIPIPFDPFTTRDPAGAISQTETGINVKSAVNICRVDTDARALIECHPAEGPPPGRAFEKTDLGVPGPTHIERGSQMTAVQSSCRVGDLYLAAGTGDYTQQDTIRLFESTVVSGIIVEKPLSDFLHFSGPVLALQPAGLSPRAIVRNLQTGNYEAYRISITCGG